MEKLAAEKARLTTPEPAPDEPPPAEWWDSVLSDPRAAGKPSLPIQQRRLSEIPRHLLRVECLRCFRAVEIQWLDAIKLYGPHAVWKDVGQVLLDGGCQHRTGRHEEDGHERANHTACRCVQPPRSGQLISGNHSQGTMITREALLDGSFAAAARAAVERAAAPIHLRVGLPLGSAERFVGKPAERPR